MESLLNKMVFSVLKRKEKQLQILNLNFLVVVTKNPNLEE